MKVKKSFNLTYQHLGKPMIKSCHQPHSRLRKHELQAIFNPNFSGIFHFKGYFPTSKKAFLHHSYVNIL